MGAAKAVGPLLRTRIKGAVPEAITTTATTIDTNEG